MSTQPHESFEEAVKELRRSQERLRSLRKEMQSKATKVTSKDGMITVALDGKSEITSISFNTAKFRRMAPAELGAVLVETINRARSEGRARVIDAYRSMFPAGMDIDAIMSGKFNVDNMFDDAVRRADAIMADGKPGPVPATR
ncbi:MAG TPA: YbaB/EbfC family nucleoid-associated protein [Streptosporangiaceae bacterium]|nr:YbaB/EbfC family nucleoid-associated protein [Streptosporangiaceae bacterium]